MQTVAIVGLGLMGGSLGQALRRTGRYRVIGIARKSSTLRQAKRLKAIDWGSIHFSAVASADIIVVATPVDDIVPTVQRINRFKKPAAIMTDIGSVKSVILNKVKNLKFVGGHPLAGSHKTGVQAARPDLYMTATCVLIPVGKTSLKPIKVLWQAVGARPIVMSAKNHDIAVGLISHLPHIIAHALVHSVMDHKDRKHLKLLLAGSFRDVTRVAASDPEQWRQILQSNIPAVRSAIRSFKKELSKFEKNLSKPGLKKLLVQSHLFRLPLFNEK